MKLSIIIPQYKEDKQTLKRLLNTIDMQKQVDFNELEVLIVNDCSKYKPSEDIGKGYPFKVAVYQTEKNGGPGLARQYGFERAKGEYILYLDADDCLISVISLRYIMNYTGEADIIKGKFFNENLNKVDNGWTWVHGKFYRKQFLIDSELKFPDGIRVNEDSYFNMLAGVYTTQIEEINEIVTFWAKNTQSITRTNTSDFVVKCFGDFIKGKLEGFRVLRNKGYYIELKANLLHFFVYTYYYFQMAEFCDEKTFEIRENYEKNIAKVLKEFYNILMGISEEDINQALNNEFIGFSKYVNYRLRETFDEYRQRLYEKEI